MFLKGTALPQDFLRYAAVLFYGRISGYSATYPNFSRKIGVLFVESVKSAIFSGKVLTIGVSYAKLTTKLEKANCIFTRTVSPR